MLQVYVRTLGEVTVVCLRGRVGVEDVSTLRHAVLSQLDKAAVILDFSHVSGIDAAGLGLLLELRKHSLTKHIEFKIMNVTPLIRQVFAITCLDSIFQISAEANAPIVRGRVATSLRLPACA